MPVAVCVIVFEWLDNGVAIGEKLQRLASVCGDLRHKLHTRGGWA